MNYLNIKCPVCGGYIVLLDNGSEMCEKCHYVLPSSTHASDATKASSSDMYCDRCRTKLEQSGDWWICPECHYGYMVAIEDLPKDIYWADGVAHAWGKLDPNLSPQTLTITSCEKFKVQLKEIDIEFELDPNKLENIDTLIINGYKYRKEK